MTERAKAERKLAWTLLRPRRDRDAARDGLSDLLRAIYLSLQRATCASLTTRSSSGFRTTSTCSPSTWWTDVFNTLVITVSSVAIELVLGMLIALVMHRAIFGRGPVRAAIP